MIFDCLKMNLWGPGSGSLEMQLDLHGESDGFPSQDLYGHARWACAHAHDLVQLRLGVECSMKTLGGA